MEGLLSATASERAELGLVTNGLDAVVGQLLQPNLTRARRSLAAKDLGLADAQLANASAHELCYSIIIKGAEQDSYNGVYKMTFAHTHDSGKHENSHSFQWEKSNDVRYLEINKDRHMLFFDSKKGGDGRWTLQTHHDTYPNHPEENGPIGWGKIVYQSEVVPSPSADDFASHFPPFSGWTNRGEPAKGFGALAPMLHCNGICSQPLPYRRFRQAGQELPVFIINLDRSADRLRKTTKAYIKRNPDAHPLIRVQAVDGASTNMPGALLGDNPGEWRKKYDRLFNDDRLLSPIWKRVKLEHHKESTLVAATCLSHYRAWKALLISGADGGVIIEDDTELVAGIGPKLLAVLDATQYDMKGGATDKATAEGQWDLVFISHSMHNSSQLQAAAVIPNTIIPFNTVGWHQSGATAYYLSRAGAVLLMDAVAKVGFFAPADYFLYFQMYYSNMKMGYTLNALGGHQTTNAFHTLIHGDVPQAYR
jgi:GR25 family glycosyltransferase involved in LPS biosynthesis